MPKRWPFGRRGPKPRVDFQRPDGWHNLDGTESRAAQAPTPPPPPPIPPRDVPPPPPPPPTSPSHSEQRHEARSKLRLWRPVFVVAILSVIVLIGAWNVAEWLNDRSGGHTPGPPEPPATGTVTDPHNRPPRATDDAPTVWALTFSDLRPDLADGRFLTHPSGFMDSTIAIDAGDIWAVASGGPQGGDILLHGLDADTGKEAWRRPMDGVFCADDLLNEELFCAVPKQRERGLGTSWTLHLIDPATGETTSSADFDGWLSALVVEQGHVLILEQRLPAPHALITGLDDQLDQVWQFDLSQEEGHADLFSDNRLIIRPEEYPEGPALDRPRVRRVADGLTALWIGARTAFVDVPNGELVGMPHCSRLVDDGNRLWCNAGGSTVAYDHELNAITRTEAGVRLAFPNRDPREGDISIPAFLDEGGALLRVNPTTGATLGPLVNTGMGNAFGMSIQPSTASIDGVLVVADNSQTAAIDAETGEVRWESQYEFSLHDPFLHNGTLLATDFHTHQVDLATGEILNSWRISGIGVVAVGEHLASYSVDQLARLDLS